MGNAESISSSSLGRLSLTEARAVFGRFDKKHVGVLEREAALAFLVDVLRREGRTGAQAKSESVELFARLDKNGDGTLSWQELTGVAFKHQGKRQIVAYEGALGEALSEAPLRMLHRDERLLVAQWMSRVVPLDTLVLVCKQLHADVATLQSLGLIRTVDCRAFDPHDSQRLGRVTCHFPTLTLQQLELEYAQEPWLARLKHYCDEMEHRPLTQLEFKDIFFYTDAQDVSKLKVELAINGTKVRTYNLSDPRSDFMFMTSASSLVKEAKGEVPKPQAPEYKGVLGELMEDKYNTYDKRVRNYEDHKDFMERRGHEFVDEADRNDAVLHKADRMGAVVLHASSEYPYMEGGGGEEIVVSRLNLLAVPKGVTYGKTLLTITIRHGSLIVGSVSIALGVFGWLESEFPFYNGDHIELGLKFQCLAPAPPRHVDPSYLGARTQLIITGLKKTIR